MGGVERGVATGEAGGGERLRFEHGWGVRRPAYRIASVERADYDPKRRLGARDLAGGLLEADDLIAARIGGRRGRGGGGGRLWQFG